MKNYKKYAPLILIVLLIDQATKIYFYQLLAKQENSYIEVTNFFNLVVVWNTGISFGMFSGNPLNPYIFGGIAIIISGIILYMMKEASSKIELTAYALIVGGAMGNLVDRVRFKAVFDFLDFHLNDYHWPAFNIADSAVCIGATLLFISLLIPLKKLDKNKL